MRVLEANRSFSEVFSLAAWAKTLFVLMDRKEGGRMAYFKIAIQRSTSWLGRLLV